VNSGQGTANYGFSLGLGQNLLSPIIYLVLAISFLVWVCFQKKKYLGYWLIVGGGLTNGISRLIFGYVWDYFHWNYLFSVWFNLADVSITLGVVLALCSV